MMKLTIKKLKDAIQDLPDDMLVVVDGYERGITSTKKASVAILHSYKDSECSVYGEFINEQDQFFDIASPVYKMSAFHLSRFGKNENI